MTDKNFQAEGMLGKLCDATRKSYVIPPEKYNKYDVKRGLRNHDGSGVLAGLTNISEVHGYVVREDEKTSDYGTLAYRGYDINDLAQKCGINGRYKFEEACYLLLFGRQPTKLEFENFIEYFSENRFLPNGFTEDMILKQPSRDLMNKLGRSVLTLYSYDEQADNCSIENVLRQSIELIARMPILAAYAYQAKAHYFDEKSLILHQPLAQYSIAENLLRMTRPTGEFTPEEAELLDTCLLLHAEHGGGNNSAFSCRVLSSSGTDTYSALAGAICALKGPRHGGANSKVMSMMRDIKANITNWENEDEVYNYLAMIVKKEAFDHSGLIYGVGHVVYTLSDPRAAILKEHAKNLAEGTKYEAEFKLYNLVERLAPVVLREVKGSDKVVSANVDFYSGFVYKMLKLPEELYTPLFAVARSAGWCAHRIEEIISGGKILRPAYKSICKIGKEFVEMENRTESE